MAHAYIQLKCVTDLLLKYNETMIYYSFYLYFEFSFLYILLWFAFICSHFSKYFFFFYMSVCFIIILFVFIFKKIVVALATTAVIKEV